MQQYTITRDELFDINMKIKCKIKAELKKQRVEFSPVHHKALIKLHSSKGSSQQMLAVAMRRNKAQIARIVASLHQQGFIDKEADIADKRSVKLTITTKGTKLLARMNDLDMEIIRKMLVGFNSQEKEIFNTLLTRANQSLE